MSLAGVAKANQQIVDRGGYRAPSGRMVTMREQVDAAVAGARLHRPAELQRLLDTGPPAAGSGAARIEVAAERTGEGARRLALEVGSAPLALNFASARSPGGGYVRGARAQEEDLARCSALYFTQLTQPRYYEANREQESLLYTDHMIYSPSVPFFRDESYDLLEEPVLVSVVTAPAPNAGEFLRRDPGGQPAVEHTLRRRAGMVLALAEHRGDRHLVLGAWGCGVFRNAPDLVADAFARWLESPRFAAAFARVVFAVHDRSADRETLHAFQRRFAA